VRQWHLHPQQQLPHNTLTVLCRNIGCREPTVTCDGATIHDIVNSSFAIEFTQTSLYKPVRSMSSDCDCETKLESESDKKIKTECTGITVLDPKATVSNQRYLRHFR